MSTLFGVDCTSSPPVDALKAANVGFVYRYIAPPGNIYDWKRVSAAEIKRLHDADIAVGLVFETSAKRAAAGKTAGSFDGDAAKQVLADLKAPDTVVPCFAVDFDIPDYAPNLANTPANAMKKLGPVYDYFNAANMVLGVNRTGGYGGYWAIKRLFDAGLISVGWQTYAWSAGQWDPRAQVQQYSNGHKMGGVSVDYDRAIVAQFGQWPPAPPKPGPAPAPAEGWPGPDVLAAIVKNADQLRALQGYWPWLEWRLGESRWKAWGPMNDAVRPDVAARIPQSWWQQLKAFLGARQ